MSKFKPFLLGSIFGAGLIYASLQYHVVQSSEGLFLVPRAPQANIGLAYADIRRMTPEQLAANPELARAMAAHEAKELLARNEAATSDRLRNDLEGALGDGSDRLTIPDRFGQQSRDAFDNASDDWGSRANNELDRFKKEVDNKLDAPIWNPFANKDAAPDSGDELFRDQVNGGFVDNLKDTANDWLNEATESESPFRDITDSVVDGANKRSDQLLGTLSRPSGSQPAPSSVRRTNRVPLPPINDVAKDTRDSVTRRAREIYERSRRRASEGLSSEIMDRTGSRASSLIDELISPPTRTRDAIDRAAESVEPSRYYRRRSGN